MDRPLSKTPSIGGKRGGFRAQASSPVPPKLKETNNFHETKSNVFMNTFQANGIENQDEVEDQMVYGIKPEGCDSTFTFVSRQPMWYQSSAFFAILFFLVSTSWLLYGDELKNWVKDIVGLRFKKRTFTPQQNAGEKSTKEEIDLENKTPLVYADLHTLLNLLIAHKSKKISKTAALYILENYYHKTHEEALNLLKIS